MNPTIDHSPEFQDAMLKHGDKDRQIERMKESRMTWRIIAASGWLTLLAIMIREFSKTP